MTTHSRPRDKHMPLVVHLSPTYFAPESYIGGGERYAEELSRAMSSKVNVRFVSFGREAFRERLSPTYERLILKNASTSKMTPFSARLFQAINDADVIHCHQYFSLPTFAAAVFGWVRKKPVFISDLGGGGWTPAYHLDQSRLISAHLPISEYAAGKLHGRNRKHTVIYGGLDLSAYPMRAEATHDGSVVFLGRLLPHKGIHILIAGLPVDVRLIVIGPVTDKDYFQHLKMLAQKKRVQFLSDLPDERVKRLLRSAMAIVHPTPVTAEGDAAMNELFGLAPVEAMASGCVPVLSAAASLPELIEEHVSGFLVAPNCPSAIGDTLLMLSQDPLLWSRVSRKARERVEKTFTWGKVVERCLIAYGIA